MTRDDPILPPEAACEYLGDVVKPATLQWWRVIGRGPEYIKIGHRIGYRKSALDAFIKNGIVAPEVVA